MIDRMMMKAAVLDQAGRPLVLSEVKIPEPKQGEMLVRLDACGVCHTDVHIWKGDEVPARAPSPFVLGHEGVGTVVTVGPGVSGWKTGEPVGVPWLHSTCMHCDECLEGEESFCQHQMAHGFNVSGAFAEYVIVDHRFAVRLAAEMDPMLTAPVMCAGLTAFGALRRAKTKSGEVCAIFGCGGLGLYAVQIAKRMGAEVIAVDRDPEKLGLARGYGATMAILADDNLVARLNETTRPHACINFAPTSSTWAPMVNAIRPRGRIVAAALVSQPVPLNQDWLTGTGVTITGTSVGTREEMCEVVHMHSREPLKTLVEAITLHEVSDALMALSRGEAKGRFVIRF